MDKEKLKKTLKESLPSILAAIALAFLITRVVMPSIVREESMLPNFCDGDYIFVNKLAYTNAEPQRGDVVVVKSNGRYLIKRIIALPGETIKITEGKVYINKEVLDEPYLDKSVETSGQYEVELGSEEYFVMGDNRSVSMDSRHFGSFDKDLVAGKVVYRLFPFDRIGKI